MNGFCNFLIVIESYSMSGFRPIIAVGMSLVRDCSRQSPEGGMLMEKALADYVDGIISFDMAARVFMENAGTIKPLVRVQEILSVDDKPLPAHGELFVASPQGDSRAVNPRKKARPWTEQEDTRLLAAIHKFGLDAWGPITDFVGSGRSRAQCSQRWFRGLDPRISKVLWTSEEEQRLVNLVRQYGDHSWTKVATALGNRSDAQCRYRYYQLVGSTEEHEIQKDGHRFVPQVMSTPARGLEMAKRQALSGVNRHASMRFIPKRIPLPPITELLKDDIWGKRAFEMPCLVSK